LQSSGKNYAGTENVSKKNGTICANGKCKYEFARVENVVHLNICVKIITKLSMLVKQR